MPPKKSHAPEPGSDETIPSKPSREWCYEREIFIMKRTKAAFVYPHGRERRSPLYIIAVCRKAHQLKELLNIRDAWAAVLYVQDGMSHLDLWMMALAAWVCRNDEVFGKATRKLLWEREKPYGFLCKPLESDKLFSVQWPLCCESSFLSLSLSGRPCYMLVSPTNGQLSQATWSTVGASCVASWLTLSTWPTAFCGTDKTST